MAQARGEDVIALTKLNLDPASDDDEDEFEPLFSYSRALGPAPTFLSDDSDTEETAVVAASPRRKPATTPAKESPKKPPVKMTVISDDDDDDDDCCQASTSSPPKLPKKPQPVSSGGCLALQHLRQRRKELMMLQEETSLAAISRVEEQTRRQVLLQRVEDEKETESPSPLVVTAPEVVWKSPSQAPNHEAHSFEEKEKIMLRVQNKAGDCRSFRIFTTDKFVKLFTVYANALEASLANLSFRFDGDLLSPTSTPKELDMDDGDVIEVYTKS